MGSLGFGFVELPPTLWPQLRGRAAVTGMFSVVLLEETDPVSF